MPGAAEDLGRWHCFQRKPPPRSTDPARFRDYYHHIHSDREILGGKPVVRGTRLTVGFLLGLLGEGWSQEQLLESYPQLTPDAIRAGFAFASETLHEESFYSVDLGAA